MTVFAGPFFLATCLLGIAGFAKALQPTSTAGALAAMRVPHRRWMIRMGGFAEALLACAALATGDPMLAIFVALSYVAFAVFVILALRAGAPLSSCGCLGRIDTPPHLVHVVLDLLAASAAVVFAVQGAVSIFDVFADQPGSGVPFAAILVVGVAAAVLAMSALPRTLAAARGRSA